MHEFTTSATLTDSAHPSRPSSAASRFVPASEDAGRGEEELLSSSSSQFLEEQGPSAMQSRVSSVMRRSADAVFDGAAPTPAAPPSRLAVTATSAAPATASSRSQTPGVDQARSVPPSSIPRPASMAAKGQQQASQLSRQSDVLPTSTAPAATAAAAPSPTAPAPQPANPAPAGAQAVAVPAVSLADLHAEVAACRQRVEELRQEKAAAEETNVLLEQRLAQAQASSASEWKGRGVCG